MEDIDSEDDIILYHGLRIQRKAYADFRAFLYAGKWIQFAVSESIAHHLQPEQYELPIAEQETLLEEAGVAILGVSFSKSKSHKNEYSASWKKSSKRLTFRKGTQF